MRRKFWTTCIVALIIGGCGEIEWFPETKRLPTSPDAFYFVPAALTNVATGSTQTSNAITVAGIQAGPAPISVSGDPSSKYSINGGAYTSAAGTVNNSDKVTVQHTAASGVGQTVTTKLTIEDKSATFSSTTANVASFALTASGPANSFVTATTALVCIPGTYEISIANGNYSLDGFSFTNVTQPVFIFSGQILWVQNLAAGSSGGTVTTTVTIGGVTSTFVSTAL